MYIIYRRDCSTVKPYEVGSEVAVVEVETVRGRERAEGMRLKERGGEFSFLLLIELPPPLAPAPPPPCLPGLSPRRVKMEREW